MSQIKLSEVGGVVGSWPAIAIKPIVFEDVNDVDFDKAPYPATHYARAFIPFQSGVIRLVFPDGTTFDKTVVADKKYVITVRRFNATGTVTVTSGEMHN